MNRATAAQWKQEILWTESSIAETEEIATNLHRIVLDISSIPELKEGHTKPGQFVQMKVKDSKPAFIAISSAPKVAESGALELLIKDAEGTTAALLCDLSRGDRVEVSQVLGKGFNVDLLTPPEEYPAVLLFATGSGISPVRSLIEAGIDAGKRRDVRLYYGAHDLDHMAFRDKFAAWEASGVKVIPVLSTPLPGWEGESGYVQHAFGRSQSLSDPAKTGAVLVGQKAMAEELTAMLVEAGITKERILMNF